MPQRRKQRKAQRSPTRRKRVTAPGTSSRHRTQRKRVGRQVRTREGQGDGKASTEPPTPAFIAKRLLGSPAQCAEARLPRQYASNCWLNACITSFFASEGMSVGGRTLRRLMQEPRTVQSRSDRLTAQMKADLRRLSKVIEAIPTGRIEREYSTATLINGLLAIDGEGLTTPRNRLGAAVGRSHNPLWMYSALAKLLLPGRFPILKCDLTDRTGLVHTSLAASLTAAALYNAPPRSAAMPKPRALFIEAGQETGASEARRELLDMVASGRTLRAGGVSWQLDSIVMLDTTNSHFGGIVTCAGRPHSYDGMTGAKLHPKGSWKNVVESFRGRKIPTPAPQDFKYNIHNGYTIFAFVRS